MSKNFPENPTSSQSSESFAELFAASMKDSSQKQKMAQVGDFIQGKVIRVGKEFVFLDIGVRADAMISLQELAEVPKIGDVIKGRVIDIKEGILMLSNRLQRDTNLRDHLQLAFEQKIPVEGKVTGLNKAGFDVDLGGVRAFLPSSQMELRGVSDPQSYVGRTITVEVTQYQEGKNAVVSRRVLLEKEQKEQAVQLKSRLVPGAVLSGVVITVHDFGAFVDLGGMQGFIPTREMGYGRGLHPNAIVKPGQVVEAVLLTIEPDSKSVGGVKLSLSLKQLMQNPLDEFLAQISEGQKITGKVVHIESFGAFVEIQPGVEGFLPLSGMAEHPIKNPKEIVQVGQEIMATISRIELDKQRFSMSLVEEVRQARLKAAQALTLGDVISVVVERVEPYGVLVRVPGQIGGKEAEPKGIISNNDLGLEKRSDTKQQFPLGKEIKAMVKSIESDGRIRLSIKAIQEAEERASMAAYTTEATANSGKVTLGDLIKRKQEESKKQ